MGRAKMGHSGMDVDIRLARAWFFFSLTIGWIALGLLVVACTKSANGETHSARQSIDAPKDIFDRYLQVDQKVADGFDFPVGTPDGDGQYIDRSTGRKYSGWVVSTQFGEEYSLGVHPGEDFNGSGGGNTDLGQPVHATGAGRVVFAGHCGPLWGKVVVIRHLFYENHLKRYIHSVYVHLRELVVKVGQDVHRRQIIGTIGRDPEGRYWAHLHFELRWNERLPPNYWPSSAGKSAAWIERNYAPPSRFIRSHRRLVVPQAEGNLVLVDSTSYRLRRYVKGILAEELRVAFGQATGRKRRRGDLRTPLGMYFVVDKHRGKFGGPYGAYYGGHWIKLNYPNAQDAAWGQRQGLISEKQRHAIAQAWQQRKATLGSTRLGGGIGFHGWASEWDDTGPRHLSWGCIVLHNRDISGFYDAIPLGATVVIL